MKNNAGFPIDLSIAILNWNNVDVIFGCLDSIKVNVSNKINIEILVVDNNSTDGSLERIEKSYPWVKLIKNKSNLGFAEGNNQCFRISKGKYFLLLNSDTIVYKNSLESMVDFLDKSPEYGAVTCKLLNPDGSTQFYMHRRFPNFFYLINALIYKRIKSYQPFYVKKYLYLDKDFNEDFDVEQAAGACVMLRTKAFEEDREELIPQAFKIYFNDVYLSYKLWKSGHKIRCLTEYPITHVKGVSVKKLDPFTNGVEYMRSSQIYFKSNKMFADYFLLKMSFFALLIALLSASTIKYLIGKLDIKDLKQRYEIFETVVFDT